MFETLAVTNTGKPCTVTIPDTISVSTSTSTGEMHIVPLLSLLPDSQAEQKIPTGSFKLVLGDSWFLSNNSSAPTAIGTDPSCSDATGDINHIRVTLGALVVDLTFIHTWTYVCSSKPSATIDIEF
jgi:hypothetical protein